MRKILGLVAVGVLLAGCSGITEPQEEIGAEPELAQIAPESSPEEVASEEAESSAGSWQVSADVFNESIENALSIDYDEFDEVTRYTWGGLDWVDSVAFAGSISVDGNQQLDLVVLSVAYFDEDWLFFDSLEVRAGGTTYGLGTFRELVNKTENVESGGWVSEVGGVSIGTDQEVALEAILNDPEAKFRLEGTSGTKERAFSVEERDLIRSFYNGYQGFAQGLEPR